MASPRTAQPMVRPSEMDVLAAVRSLCADELKPLGRLILKRLRERAAAAEAAARGLAAEEVDPETTARIDPKQLRRVCEGCKFLRIDPEEGKEYSAVPIGQVCLFVDVCSQQDPFSPQFWASAVAYFRSLPLEDTLPCGRYACARALVMRQLPFLRELSLGRVCH